MTAPDQTDLLTFFQTIFPEEIYAFGTPVPARAVEAERAAAAGSVAAGPAIPAIPA